MAAKKKKKPAPKKAAKKAAKKPAPKKPAPKKAAKKPAPKKAAKKPAPKKAAKKPAAKKPAAKKPAPKAAKKASASTKTSATKSAAPVKTRATPKTAANSTAKATTSTAKKTAGARVCWHDLMTTNPVAAREFYAALLPWKTRPVMMQPLGETQRIEAGGTEIGGIVALPEAEGIASHWMPYVQVADLDAVVRRARDLGGYVPVPPTKLEGVGRFAVIADPRGAHVSPIELSGPMPTANGSQPGFVTWNEIVSDDPVTSARFFAGVFGWTPSEQEMGSMGKYIMLNDGADQVAGVARAMENVPPHWLSYWNTSDIERSVAKAKTQGAQVPMPPMDIPDIGRVAVVVDPTGALFALHQPVPM